jgi:hypothetical protein
VNPSCIPYTDDRVYIEVKYPIIIYCQLIKEPWTKHPVAINNHINYQRRPVNGKARYGIEDKEPGGAGKDATNPAGHRRD